MLTYAETPFQQLSSNFLEKARVRVFIKREDLNHPLVAGNKWWKLKHNLEQAKQAGCRTLLTFGGAYSNHIYATAAAAGQCGFESIGIIRGEETLPLNATLAFAVAQGMRLRYVSREAYRTKTESGFIENLKSELGEFYLIPEGGTNSFAVKGCVEWTEKLRAIEFDYLCLPVGTGGTIAGLIAGLPDKKVIGYSVLKYGESMKGQIQSLARECSGKEFSNWRIEDGYHFGGYAKSNRALADFVRSFKEEHAIPLEEIYTGKMMFGILDGIKLGKFEPGSTLLAIHTGGLQGK